MMKLKPTVYAFTLLSAMVACSPDSDPDGESVPPVAVPQPSNPTGFGEPGVPTDGNPPGPAQLGSVPPGSNPSGANQPASTQSGSAQPGSAGNATGSAGNPTAESFSGFQAILQPTEGHDVTGTVMFSETEEGVTIAVNVQGLPPMSTHGFHIHETGDCSAPDASSAGGHYNPDDQPHGAPDAPQRHAGDLGNLISDGVGMAQTSLVDSHLTFRGDNSSLGRAVVIHANADDLETQPSGDAGARIACGIIAPANN